MYVGVHLNIFKVLKEGIKIVFTEQREKKKIQGHKQYMQKLTTYWAIKKASLNIKELISVRPWSLPNCNYIANTLSK